MTKVTQAVYSKDVLKPTEDLGSREEQRVRLIVETVDGFAVTVDVRLGRRQGLIVQPNARHRL